MELTAVSFAAVTTICYLLAQGLKATRLDRKWLPVICGALGGLLGVGAMYAGVPDFPAGDPLTAASVGIISGLAATGVNQAYRQLGGNSTRASEEQGGEP